MINLVVTGDSHGADVYEHMLEPKFILETSQPYDVRIEVCSGEWSGELSQGGSSFDISSLSKVYIRRPLPNPPDSSLPEHAQEFISRETQEVIGALAAFCHLNNNSRLFCQGRQFNTSSNKIAQLIAACELGLNIPATCITNMPRVANEFYNRCKGRVVYKCLSTPVIGYSDGKRSMIHTSAVPDNNFSEVKNCPCLFQNNISKDYELRLAVIGDKVIPVGIDSQKYQDSLQDWRANISAKDMYRSELIEPEIAAKLVALNEKLGTPWSMVDMIVDKDGRYIYLESNPDGSWLWLDEILPTLGVSQAIAKHICL